MKGNAGRRLIYGLLLAAGFSFSTYPAWGQGLPAGKGMDVVALVCTQCHGLDYLVRANGLYSAETWENALYEMIARGAPVEEKDREVVLKYLIDSFAKK